eukprot:12862367-Heterocapsa_arctica.AAC.1
MGLKVGLQTEPEAEGGARADDRAAQRPLARRPVLHQRPDDAQWHCGSPQGILDEALLAKNCLISRTTTTALRALHDTHIDFVKLQFEQSPRRTALQRAAVKHTARIKDGQLHRLPQGPAAQGHERVAWTRHGVRHLSHIGRRGLSPRAWTTPKRIPSSGPSCAHHVRPPRLSEQEPVCIAAPADPQEVREEHRQRHHDVQ